MAIRFNIPEADVKRQKIVKPTWYPLVVTSVTEESSKKGEHTNIKVEMIGLAGEAKGVPFTRWFPETYPGFAVEFLRACGAIIPEEGAEVDFESAKGKKLDGYVTNTSNEGKTQNNLESFAPFGTKTKFAEGATTVTDTPAAE